MTGVGSLELSHLDAPGLVGQEEAEDEQQTLVAVGETQPDVMVIRPARHVSLMYCALSQGQRVMLKRPANPDLRLVHDVFVLILRDLCSKRSDFPGKNDLFSLNRQNHIFCN